MTSYPEAPGNYWDVQCPRPGCTGRRRLQMRPPQAEGPGTWECTLHPETHCGYVWPHHLRTLGPLFGEHPVPARLLQWCEGVAYLDGRRVAWRRA